MLSIYAQSNLIKVINHMFDIVFSVCDSDDFTEDNREDLLLFFLEDGPFRSAANDALESSVFLSDQENIIADFEKKLSEKASYYRRIGSDKISKDLIRGFIGARTMWDRMTVSWNAHQDQELRRLHERRLASKGNDLRNVVAALEVDQAKLEKIFKEIIDNPAFEQSSPEIVEKLNASLTNFADFRKLSQDALEKWGEVSTSDLAVGQKASQETTDEVEDTTSILHLLDRLDSMDFPVERFEKPAPVTESPIFPDGEVDVALKEIVALRGMYGDEFPALVIDELRKFDPEFADRVSKAIDAMVKSEKQDEN